MGQMRYKYKNLLIWIDNYLVGMSAELVKRVDESRQAALEKGTVIKLRKEDIIQAKILGKGQKY